MTRLFPQKSIYWVWVPGVNPKPKTKINSVYCDNYSPASIPGLHFLATYVYLV